MLALLLVKTIGAAMRVSEVLSVSMADDMSRLEKIAHNIANISTPGFKRTIHSSPWFGEPVSDLAVGRTRNGGAVALYSSKSQTDWTTGAMKTSGNPHDIWLEPGQFIEVATPEGAAFIRQARLRVDSEGRLVDQAERPVRAAGGGLVLMPKEFSVGPGGEIVQDGRVVGQLTVVVASESAVIEPAGNGAFKIHGAIREAYKVSIKTGVSEMSNIDTTTEMTRLLETVRHFEAMQKIELALTEMHDKASHYLGEF